jgi:hypothetical protein
MRLIIFAFVFVILGGLLGASFLVFRAEQKNSASPPSTATRWRFYVAVCGCCVFVLAPINYYLHLHCEGVLAYPFILWPVAAVWLMAAPVNYRFKSAYLLSAVSLLTILAWWVFWHQVPMPDVERG